MDWNCIFLLIAKFLASPLFLQLSLETFLWDLTIKREKNCEMNIQFKDLWWNNWMLSCFKNGTCYVGTTKDYYRSTTTYICCVNYSRGIVSWNFDDLNFNFRKNKWLFYSWQIFLCNFSKIVEQFMCRKAKNRAKNLFQKALNK